MPAAEAISASRVALEAEGVVGVVEATPTILACQLRSVLAGPDHLTTTVVLAVLVWPFAALMFITRV